MVFLIQNTQNRDSKAIHLKLDELIVAQKNARNSMLELEDLSDEEIKRIQAQFNDLCTRRFNQLPDSVSDNDTADVEVDGNDNNERLPDTGNNSMDKMKRMAHRN
jgi:low affinity Fe/Cu permease